ncbi:MAG TPA: helix-turn-helix domain-containing protein [Fimbriimonadaceae bacterium]|nr:helix-turn-helix domain-containing protein [Fimbriimonadaceae bacterium]
MITKSEVIAHPIRLRILGVVGSRRMTPRQIAEKMPDVAQATLYRQIKVLHETGMLEVVEQRQAHGAVESTYAIRKGAAHLSREEFAAISPEDHAASFSVIQGTAYASLRRYFEQPDYDTTRDGMTYFGANLVLTDEEARQLRLDILDLLRRYIKEPASGRPRQITISLIPQDPS